MEYCLENGYLKAVVESKGAELKSLKRKADGCEMMWEADPSFWKESSPFLFPFTGKCRGLKYCYQGKIYEIPQHGFGRRLEFEKKECQEEGKLILVAESDETTLAVYPFAFHLEIIFSLEESALKVEWQVTNTGKAALLYSIGGHPGFACPPNYERTAGNQDRNTCTIRLYGAEDQESLTNLCVSENGLLSGETVQIPVHKGLLPVTEHLFDKDALLLPRQDITAVGFLDSKGREYVRVSSETPIWGLWSVADNKASYICVEPWFGLCDREGYEGTLEERPLMTKVEPGECSIYGYSISVC